MRETTPTHRTILHVLEDTAPPRLILAHMGSNGNYQEAEEKLCGKNVYFDTSYSIMHMEEEQFTRMIHLHGADKVLFGTDAPWTYQKDCVEKLKSLTGLSEKEKQQILWGYNFFPAKDFSAEMAEIG